MKVLVGNMPSKDLRMARQIDALLVCAVAPLARVVKAVVFAHDGLSVDLRWAQRETQETEDRGTASTMEAVPVACDPAPF